MTPAARNRVLMLVLAAVQLVLFAPGTALAHEGGPAHHAAHGELASADPARANFAAPCPGGSGHACGCGNLDAVSGGCKPVAAGFPGWRAAGNFLPVQRVNRSAVPAATLSLALSSDRPRAPPEIA